MKPDAFVYLDAIDPFDADHLPYKQGFIIRPYDSLASLKHPFGPTPTIRARC